MPSKGKKSSKPDRSPISRAPSTPTSARGAESDNDDELHLQRLLSQASAKFPNFINESAFIGRICDQDSDLSKGNQARVWLSESAMVSFSISPGSLVSVALPASGKKSLSNCPLDSLVEECARHLGVDAGDDNLSGAGNYFAIATVFPSRKVLKNGVKLSWALSCTMGIPAAGKSIFLFPLRSSDKLNKKANNTHIYLHKCKDFHLSLVLPRVVSDTSNKGLSINGTLLESARVISEEGVDLSPKTPISQPKLSSPGATPVYSRKPHDSIARTGSSISSDISSVRLALADEKANKLLQASVTRWLYGRYLLCGNIVTVPLILGHICAFLVESGDDFLTDCNNQDLMHEENQDLLSREMQVCTSWEKSGVAFLLDTKTNILLSDPMSLVRENSSKRGVLKEDRTCKTTSDTEAFDQPKLGGLSKEFAALKEIIMFSLANKGHLPRYKGVLLHGPPGTGKTSLAAACAHDAGASLFSINGPEIISQYYGESEQALHEVFESARRAAPAVVFIDELDAIAPTRKDAGEELSLRMVATLLKLMDEIKRDENILVIAATNRPDSIDPAMRRPGRLDRELEIGVPSPEQRLDILHNLLGGIDHSISNVEVQALAAETHGFVGADLAALCNEAAMTSLRRHINFTNSARHFKDPCSRPNGLSPNMQASELHRKVDGLPVDVIDSLSSSLSELNVTAVPLSPISSHGESGDASIDEVNRTKAMKEETSLKVTADDFSKAKMKVRPSAMREVMLELPKVRWEDVGGQGKVKKQLIEAVQWPQICPDAFKRIGIRPPRGLLMIGPPGCSKTLTARAVASEAKLNFLAVKGPELFSKWVGESEKAVRSLFAKARANSPAIIFFDELDGLAVSRGQENDGTSVADRVLSQLLVEMDGLDQRVGVTVIAATNRPDKIDPALLRPGRFDRLIDVQPPDENDREDIFRIHTRNIPCHPDVSRKELARLTEGYTGADIKLICREAAISALEESLETSEISMKHFKIGIGRVHPSDVQFYRELATHFRRIVDSGSPRDG